MKYGWFAAGHEYMFAEYIQANRCAENNLQTEIEVSSLT
jgi:hypothetical protein